MDPYHLLTRKCPCLNVPLLPLYHYGYSTVTLTEEINMKEK